MNREDFKKVMLTFLHQPYRWGGDDPMAGFDCSGLIQELLTVVDLDPPGDQSAQQLMEYFSKGENGREISFNELRTGDLVFFGPGSMATHIAMMYDEHTILEAGGGGSTTLTLQDAIKQNACVRLRPFGKRKDIKKTLRPLNLAW